MTENCEITQAKEMMPVDDRESEESVFPKSGSIKVPFFRNTASLSQL